MKKSIFTLTIFSVLTFSVMAQTVHSRNVAVETMDKNRCALSHTIAIETNPLYFSSLIDGFTLRPTDCWNTFLLCIEKPCFVKFIKL